MFSNLREEFLASESQPERRRVLTAIATGAFLYAAFGVLDASFYPEHLSVLMSVRAVVVASLLALFVVVRKSVAYWPFVLASAAAWVVGAVGIAVMCHLTEGFSSPYYAGIPLCAVVVAAICSWPLWIAVTCFLISIFSYYGPLLLGVPIEDPQLFLLHSAFVFSTFGLSLVGFSVREQLALQAFAGQRQLRERNSELARLHASKNHMFQNVSHELRTPLTLMLGPLERRIRGQSDFGVNRKSVETLHRHGLRLLKLINDLLDLAQLTTDDLPVTRQTVDLRRFVEVLVEDAGVAAEANNIKLSAQLPPEAVFYAIDPRHLERILLNLLSNAIKFTPGGGEVKVLFDANLTGPVIRVLDDGPGIDPADQERVFERFEQAQEADRGPTGGAGIGLALARELTELLEGTVTVESDVGSGSCFKLTLPAGYSRPREESLHLETVSPREELDQRALRAALYRTSAPERIVGGHRGARVLIAEDDPDLRLQLAEMLQDHYRIVAVSDGEAALSEANEFRPHLVLTDVMMPKLDGIELCRRLRQQVEFRRTAVLMLTARGSLGDRVDGRSAGADSYLTKPFETPELLSAVRGLLKARMHIVGDFLLHQRLGRGGHSTVFSAEHLTSGQPAAIKLIAASKNQPATRRDRTRLEVEALTRLDHSNIVRILAEYEQEGDFFLAMQYLSGSSIHSRLKRQRVLPIGEAAAIAQGIARALDHTHSRGLVHRDVKCSNVLLTNQAGTLADRVRLIDFGSATFLDADQRHHEGTPAYMAPEVLSGSQEASVQTDLYSVGVMLFRMCVGRLPIEPSQLESLRRGQGNRLLWDDLASEAPSELQPILARTLAFERTERWPSAAALAQALAPLSDQQATAGSTAVEPPGGGLTPTDPLTPSEPRYAN